MTHPETIERETLSADQLQAQILMLLHDALGAPAGSRDIRVAMPRWQMPDPSGSNWNLDDCDVVGDLGEPAQRARLVRDAIEEVRARYNLNMTDRAG